MGDIVHKRFIEIKKEAYRTWFESRQHGYVFEPLPYIEMNLIPKNKCDLVILKDYNLAKKAITDLDTKIIYVRETVYDSMSVENANQTSRVILSHELGHLKLHAYNLADLAAFDDDAREEEADCFARELLMRDNLLIPMIRRRKSIEEIASLFGVRADFVLHKIKSIRKQLKAKRYNELLEQDKSIQIEVLNEMKLRH